jgi:hypothetical protein
VACRANLGIFDDIGKGLLKIPSWTIITIGKLKEVCPSPNLIDLPQVIDLLQVIRVFFALYTVTPLVHLAWKSLRVTRLRVDS